MDASEIGVGAVLSQCTSSDNKIHLSTFFSCRLSPTKSNYDIGERELMDIKLALEEWSHWLEGAEHPVLVWTEHKNLSYLQVAKHLNPRQSHWALFFSCFNFSISNRPGSKNIKPDALSRLHSPDESVKESSPILPPTCSTVTITWKIEDVINQALRSKPGPKTSPPNHTYAYASIRAGVIHWFHSAKFSAHPRTSRTTALINHHFWWPSIH